MSGGSLVNVSGVRQAHGRLEECVAELRCELTVGEVYAGGTGWAEWGWREIEEELLCEFEEIELTLRYDSELLEH